MSEPITRNVMNLVMFARLVAEMRRRQRVHRALFYHEDRTYADSLAVEVDNAIAEIIASVPEPSEEVA